MVMLSLKAQQDPQYSMYMFNQLAINPAYAGCKDALSTTMLVRKQWTGIQGSPQTSTFSFHAPIINKSIGIGGYLFSETIGPKKINGAYGTYSYRIKIKNGNLALGLGTGIMNYQFNWNDVNFKDGGDVNAYSTTSNKTVFDFTSGLYYQTRSFYTGLSATHLNHATIFTFNATDTSGLSLDTRLKFQLFYTIGKGFKIGEDYIINPSFVVKYYGTKLPSVDANINFNIKRKLWLGVSFRSSYGFVFFSQYSINNQFRIGYCIDKGFNKIGLVSGLSHEIMLGYDFNFHHPKILSPRFL